MLKVRDSTIKEIGQSYVKVSFFFLVSLSLVMALFSIKWNMGHIWMNECTYMANIYIKFITFFCCCRQFNAQDLLAFHFVSSVFFFSPLTVIWLCLQMCFIMCQMSIRFIIIDIAQNASNAFHFIFFVCVCVYVWGECVDIFLYIDPMCLIQMIGQFDDWHQKPMRAKSLWNRMFK